ncbi:MAG: hypothetical protein IPG71_02895 [bacterium]|nr:hypothetical protein [bacterium]
MYYQRAQHYPTVNNLTLTGLGNELRLPWGLHSGAARYVVYSTDNTEPGNWHDAGSSTSNTFSMPDVDDIQFYRVTAEF